MKKVFLILIAYSLTSYGDVISSFELSASGTYNGNKPGMIMPNVLLNLNNLSEPYMPGDSFLINEGDTSSLSGSITSPGTQNLFDSIATELTNGNNDSFAVVLFTLTPNNIGFENSENMLFGNQSAGNEINYYNNTFQGASQPSITRLNSGSGNDLSGYIIEDITFTLNEWSADTSSGTIEVQVDVHGTAIPEPSSVAIILFGSMGMIGIRRRFCS